MRRFSFLPGKLSPACSVVVAGILATTVQADSTPAAVEFDVGYMVACRDITPPEFAQSNPLEKLVEARLQISALVRRESDEPLEFLYTIECPEAVVQIVDYQPRTTLLSDVHGRVAVERRSESHQNYGASFATPFDLVGLAKASGDARVQVRNESVERYDSLPPFEMVAASGTLNRGSGVYFKLRSGPHSSLEGSKEFVLVLQTPRTWRADYLTVQCRATTTRRSPMRTETVPCGRNQFVVALHHEGDEEARSAAAQFLRAESQWRKLATKHHGPRPTSSWSRVLAPVRTSPDEAARQPLVAEELQLAKALFSRAHRELRQLNR